MPSIDIHDLSFSYTAAPLLGGVTIHVGDGERACLVGPNGSGKTTLLKLTQGTIRPDQGSATISGLSSGAACHAPSAGSFSGSVGDYLDASLASIRDIGERFDLVAAELATSDPRPALATEYDQLLAKMTTLDVWSLDSRIDETLAGLGLPQLTGEHRSRSMSTLSPGQAGRLELAATLLAQPGVLILDEPTNHLDDEAVRFLVDLLKKRSGPLLMASHDRAFIDDVATVIYDLDIAPWQALATASGSGRLPGVHACSGSYRDYLVAKRQARAAHKELHSNQQATKRTVRAHRHESMSIAKGGVRLTEAEPKTKKFFSDRAAATSVRRTRNDDQRLKELEEREVRRPRSYDLQLPLAPVKSRGGIAVMAREAAVTGRLAPTTIDLATGEHLLLTGPNGAGKSTLLRWMVSGEPPSEAEASGSLVVSGRVGTIFQRLPRLGDPGMDHETWHNGIGERGTGVLHPSMWHTPIPELSDGNQRRAQIALATAGSPEILIIDEPTNYLDLDVIEALEAALFSWNGTLVVASHDRWLIEKWKGKRLELRSAQGAPR